MSQRIVNVHHVNHCFHFRLENILFTSVFFHLLLKSFDHITLYGSIYRLPSFRVINKVVYVTISELAYVIIG